jgi:hypothetical protein
VHLGEITPAKTAQTSIPDPPVRAVRASGAAPSVLTAWERPAGGDIIRGKSPGPLPAAGIVYQDMERCVFGR